VPNRGRLRILTVEPMEVLGWSSVTDASPRRTASARAVSATQLLAFPSDRLRQACQDDCELGSTIMQRVANVIANRLIVTRLQLLDLFASQPPEGHHA
jgi:CRP-like cAMP-binding protein